MPVKKKTGMLDLLFGGSCGCKPKTKPSKKRKKRSPNPPSAKRLRARDPKMVANGKAKTRKK